MKTADSTHHIKPLMHGGADTAKNTIKLCKKCHDCVEVMYAETGVMYSPRLAKLIRLGYALISREEATQRILSEVKSNKRHYHFTDQKDPPWIPIYRRTKIKKGQTKPFELFPWSYYRVIKLRSGTRIFVSKDGFIYKDSEDSIHKMGRYGQIKSRTWPEFLLEMGKKLANS